MLENLFLMAWNSDGDSLDQINPHPSLRTYLAYPDEEEILDQNPEIITKIFSSLRHILEKDYPSNAFNDEFFHSNTKAIRVDGMNLLIVPLPNHNVLGLVFTLDTNPYDYRNEVIRLLQEYFLSKFLIKNNQKILNTLLLTFFIDLRKYSDEFLILHEETQPIMIVNNIPMIKVFVYGIDNAGKSSLMRLLSTGNFTHDYFPPTKKFRITNIKLKSGVKLICWDMPGQRIFRNDWLRGAQASNILLFMLDSADKNRFAEAKEAFINMIDLYELQGLPVVFLINKTDLLQNSVNTQEIIDYFDLENCCRNEWKVISTSLPTGFGISELKDWLSHQVSDILMINGIESEENSF